MGRACSPWMWGAPLPQATPLETRPLERCWRHPQRAPRCRGCLPTGLRRRLLVVQGQRQSAMPVAAGVGVGGQARVPAPSRVCARCWQVWQHGGARLILSAKRPGPRAVRRCALLGFDWPRRVLACGQQLLVRTGATWVLGTTAAVAPPTELVLRQEPGQQELGQELRRIGLPVQGTGEYVSQMKWRRWRWSRVGSLPSRRPSCVQLCYTLPTGPANNATQCCAI